MKKQHRLAILGTGNIGASIANGLIQSDLFAPNQITLTRRKVHLLESFKQLGFNILQDNREAVRTSDIVIIAVEPQQLDNLLHEIRSELNPEQHIAISVVSGASIKQIIKQIGKNIPVVRAMPNTAIAIRESITCLASDKGNTKAIEISKAIFDSVGRTLVIDEEQMIPATALGACGIAFFLRAIRAASQGGIEIGFNSADALIIAAQVAKGAASLLLNIENHPEYEIDKVTTPRGCTISGLNQMEHEGFSSAMIKGITTSADKAAKLYVSE
ncbi:pyrroline-5-carboxylate reductase [candidate division KSB1 bacterium]|nr:pyrroline-5-carboxylate reductase [candidate division KSB1 bacterium]